MEILGYSVLAFGAALFVASFVVGAVGLLYGREVKTKGSLAYGSLAVILWMAARLIFWKFGYRISALDGLLVIPLLLVAGIVFRWMRR